MKNLKNTLLFFFLTNFLLINAQTKKTSFLVNGVCEMCEKRIENALDIKGIKFADWSKETKMCTVKFNPDIISEKEIHKIIAKLGHDTKMCKATNKDYNNLHQCCHYKRD